ncbi:MAG: hypothetical protein LH650_14740 [Chloroflexi bacterium]|nr:hypothetical protein [Chloroflexota bacterium]
MLLAGTGQALAVVRVVAVDEDGQVHFSILPDSVAQERASARPNRGLSYHIVGSPKVIGWVAPGGREIGSERAGCHRRARRLSPGSACGFYWVFYRTTGNKR